MKLAVFEVEEWERPSFERLDSGHDIRFTNEPLSEENAGPYTDVEVISTFIWSELDRKTLGRFRNLRHIATRSTGYDHIDMVYCSERGISVSNVPTYGDNTVAEHVFGLLLAISHNLVDAVERTRRGDFSQQGLRGFDLKGKTIGVLGTGSIGRYVIDIAKGFHMEVLAFDLRPREELARRVGFKYVSLEEALRKSDVITLHIPAAPETFHFLSDREFAMMKEGVVIINTARGILIDIQALLRAITSGKVAAVGLDVLPEEPTIREEAELLRSIAQKKPLDVLLAGHILLRLRNVLITPHSAFNTKEAVQRILDTTIENIAAFERGEARNKVA
ncbi:MAG: hydroxyacid dehydrogenase [Deltaproteobacteria bacterium]|nr:hydroxyacid dehydrogenase [Deltaproteobacteria bacterium]MCL4872623.1 hydroxyacid dehydrogenase [bacterium]